MRKVIFKIDDQEYFRRELEKESKSTGTNLQIIRETKSISMI